LKKSFLWERYEWAVFGERHRRNSNINPLNAELNPICSLLALLRAHHIFHVSGLKVKTDLM